MVTTLVLLLTQMRMPCVTPSEYLMHKKQSPTRRLVLISILSCYGPYCKDNLSANAITKKNTLYTRALIPTFESLVGMPPPIHLYGQYLRSHRKSSFDLLYDLNIPQHIIKTLVEIVSMNVIRYLTFLVPNKRHL